MEGMGRVQPLRERAPARSSCGSRCWRVVRAGAAAVVAIGLFRLAIGAWTSFEAASAGWLASVLGSAEASRAGHQLLVRGDAGVFVLTVSPWCSSAAPVLAVLAAAFAAPGRRRRRVWMATLASSMLVVGNLVRIAVVVLVGADVDPARLEPFHDGPATAFTVVLVLGAAAMVGWSTLPMRQPARVAADRFTP
jgi:exosortase/archaeosortase family protein